MSSTADARPPTTRASRVLPLAVLLTFVVASLATFVVTRRLVDDQEDRLLKERAGEVAALLSNAFARIESSLRILGGVGSVSDPGAARLFAESAGPLVRERTVAVAAAAETPEGFKVVAAVGEHGSPGMALTGEREALAERALTEGEMVSALLDDPAGKRLVLAVPPASGGRVVAYQESVLDPSTPTPQAPGSPFSGLRVALYASPRNDPARLVLTTERRVPLTGKVDRGPFTVGADRWLVAVGAREPLVGDFAERVPWFLLAGGLLIAALASAVTGVLTRRRAYALRLVDARTGALNETRAFLERLLTAGPVLVKRISLPSRDITYVSQNVERVLGVSESEALTPGFLRSLVHPDDRDDFDVALDRIAAGSSTREVIEHRVGRDDTSYRWASVVLVPETGDDGAIDAVLGYVIDIDDRRRAEEAQRAAQATAETANRSKSEFLSRMSHELRTPLNAVLGFGQLLELDELNSDQTEAVDQILKGGRHLLDLINEVLDISRIEAGELALSPEPVLAADLINEAADLIRPLADARGIQVVVDRSEACQSFVFADRQRAKQVILNLLANAVKYNRPHGTVAVTCEQVGDTRLCLNVADTGPGIPAERLGQLFMPFERLGAEQTEVEGTGIGLALSLRLTEAMGGTLTATSTLGQGSRFSVELPRVEGPVDRYERLGGTVEPAPPQAEVTPRRILHIEDNLANLKLVERIVSQRPNVEVIAAMHGGLGLELAHEHRPVLVLLDLHLPDLGGEQVLQRLRDDPVTASIPVVIVSADATPGQIRQLLSAGATAYLTKPIEVRELLRVLDDALAAK